MKSWFAGGCTTEISPSVTPDVPQAQEDGGALLPDGVRESPEKRSVDSRIEFETDRRLRHRAQRVTADCLQQNTALSVRLNASSQWIWVPYVPFVNKKRREAFKDMLTAEFPLLAPLVDPHADSRARAMLEIKIILSSQTARKQLKRCFAAFGSDHNAVSLCLFTGLQSTDKSLVLRNAAGFPR
jgi:hypothetical protein